MSGFLRELTAMLLPSRCAVCGKLTGGGLFCGDCEASFLRDAAAVCPNCGRHLPLCGCMPEALRDAGADALCRILPYDKTADGASKRLLLSLKNRHDRGAEQLLASLLLPGVEAAADGAEPIVTYVPRSRKSRAETGTDQAKRLAEAVAREGGWHAVGLLIRAGSADVQQKTLTAAERSVNAENNYRPARKLAEKIGGRTVVLVDDIVTTGASMAVCVRLLKEAGAAKVICAAAAQTMKINEQNNG